MVQCKRDGCRQHALPTGKRYCLEHRQEYEQRREEYFRVQATLRSCVGCGEKLTKTAHDRGAVYCPSCELQASVRRARAHKLNSFDEAQTVEQLKSWMREYLL